MAKLKKKRAVKVKEPEKPKELSFAEQLAMSRNKLKKTVDVKQKPPEKKMNGMDLLSAQIRLRFQNLRLHDEEDNKDDDDDDDSF